MIFPRGRIPLYLQLYWKLKEDIIFQELAPGDRVPTISKLHRKYGVSQGTVRQALELLSQEGLISLKVGTGIFVNKEITTMMLESASSSEDIRTIYKNSDYEIISEGWIEAPNRIKRRFTDQKDAMRGDQVYSVRFRQINKYDNRRKQLSDTFLPGWLIDEISLMEIHAALSEHGRPFPYNKRTQVTIHPWICSYDVGRFLGIPEGTPIFRSEWLHYFENGRIILIADSFSTVNAIVRKF